MLKCHYNVWDGQDADPYRLKNLTFCTASVSVSVWQCQVAMRRGAVPPRLLSGDKATWLVGGSSAKRVESSVWPGRKLSGRRPQCFTLWTHSPARYRRAAASIQTRTDPRTQIGTTSRHRRHHPTRSRSEYLDVNYSSIRSMIHFFLKDTWKKAECDRWQKNQPHNYSSK